VTSPAGSPTGQGPAPSPGVARWRRWARGLHWYLREVTGEADYDRYLARHAAVHPHEPAQSRREFDRCRWEDKANNPGNRCC